MKNLINEKMTTEKDRTSALFSLWGKYGTNGVQLLRSYNYRKVTVVAGIVLALIAVYFTVMSVNNFFENYRLVPQQIIQWPFRIEKKTPEMPVTKIIPEMPVVEKIKAVEPQEAPQLDRIVQYIWKHESGKGTAPSGWHKTCEAQGKWNEIGYGSNGFCFDSEEQGLAILRKTLDERLKVNPVVEVLCVYNLGYNRDEAGNRIPHNNCKYYQDYLTYGN